MNTNTLLGLLALIVVVGGGVWFFSQKDAGEQGMMDENEMMNDGTSSFAELLHRTGSWKCTVSVEIEESPSEGTVYVSDGKVRADFTSRPKTMGGTEVKTHMVQTDGYVYTWSDLLPQGMKMMLPKDSTATADTTTGVVGTDSDVDYSCAPWVGDNAQFTPPASVSFMELPSNATAE